MSLNVDFKPKKTKAVVVRLDADTRRRVEAIVESEERTVSQIIRFALRDYLNNKEGVEK